jgi:hypothetical protein
MSSSCSEPTMSEFKAFHGMVCNPVSAQKCIDYFDGGALFASQQDYARTTTNDLSFLDFTRTPIPLNLFTYYTLVLFSCTGFLSLLGQTKAPLIQDENQVMVVTVPETDQEEDAPVVESQQLYKIPGAKSLTIPRSVLWYIVDRSRDWNQDGAAAAAAASTTTTTTKEVHLIRRFEFEFGALLSVIMCHFECNGRRFLVEVYAFHLSNNNPVTRIIAFLMATAQTLLFALAQMKKKKTKER